MLFNNHRRRIHAGRPLRTTLEALEDRTTPTLPTVTTVTALPSPVAVGGTAELTATVAELNPNFSYEPFGDVVFRVGDVVVGSAALIPSETMPFVSVASISFATGTLTAGGYTVTATYPGEPGFEIDGHDPSAGTTRFELSAPAVSPPAVLPVVPSVPPPLVPTGTAVRLTAAGSDAGGPGMVQVFNGDGSRRIDIAPYGAEFTGGVRVAVADVTGDAVPDIVCAPGPGIPVVVKAYSGTDGRLVWEQPSFGDAFRSGAFVSAGDINRDGAAEVAVSPDQGGGPRVDVYAGGKFEKIVSFFGIDDPNFRGGARTAIGDFDGDGRGELAVAAGLGGGPRMAVFTGATVAAGTPARLLSDFFVFEQTLRNGVYVAAGNVAGSPADELLVGGGPGGGPRVMAFDGDGLAAGDTSRVVANFFAGDPNVRGGVRLAVGDLNGDGQGEILTGIGPGAASVVRAFRPDGGAVQDVSAFGGAFLGGVFVGGTGGSVRVSGITGGSVPGQFVDLFGQFLPGVPTRVVFADGGGYRVEVPAAEVTNNRVRVGLPVYTDPTGDISDVAFTAAVAQVTPGGEIFSPTFTRSVADIDAVGENPGDLTEEVFEDIRESLLASIFDLEYAAQFLGDGFAGEKLLDEAYAELATLDGQLGEFEELPDPGEVYVPPPAVGLDPSGFPEYPPFSVPDVSLADYGFGRPDHDGGRERGRRGGPDPSRLQRGGGTGVRASGPGDRRAGRRRRDGGRHGDPRRDEQRHPEQPPARAGRPAVAARGVAPGVAIECHRPAATGQPAVRHLGGEQDVRPDQAVVRADDQPERRELTDFGEPGGRVLDRLWQSPGERHRVHERQRPSRRVVVLVAGVHTVGRVQRRANVRRAARLQHRRDRGFSQQMKGSGVAIYKTVMHSL